MIRKSAVLATLVASVSLFTSTGASAAPVELTVRIEGKTQTLFEGPILTDGREIRPSSETEANMCDGTIAGAHPTPGPTPTAASVDAMDLVGLDFDGAFAGFDYFITRWGPDEQNPANEEFWGVLANFMLTPVGGCQWRNEAGDEVLWAYNIFEAPEVGRDGRSALRLATEDDPAKAPLPPTPTASVAVGEPLELDVEALAGEEGEEPEPEPADGVTVAPVQTAAGTGFQTVEVADPDAEVTDADGTVSVTFEEPGWHRLKAQEEEGHIRSNRLDVCVEPVVPVGGSGGCGPLPSDAQLRVPARYRALGGGGGGAPTTVSPSPPPPVGALAIRRATIDPRTGTATIEALVPGPGRVALSGSKLRARSQDATVAGVVKLKVMPTAAGRASLQESGKLAVTAQLEFQPSAGAVSSVRRKLTLRLRPPTR
jgi:hypothetical protein